MTMPQVKREPTPILAIVTNLQVLILVGAFFFHSWFYYALNITLPTFLKETMGVNLTEVRTAIADVAIYFSLFIALFFCGNKTI